MATNQADQIREFVNRKYVESARTAGKLTVTIRAGEVHSEMGLENRMPAVCSALDGKKFAYKYHLLLIGRTGPRQSSTVTWEFSV